MDGFIYVIGPRSHDYGVVKIGWSKDPKKRCATLQVGHPESHPKSKRPHQLSPAGP